jgi:hypothetical protein
MPRALQLDFDFANGTSLWSCRARIPASACIAEKARCLQTKTCFFLSSFGISHTFVFVLRLFSLPLGFSALKTSLNLNLIKSTARAARLPFLSGDFHRASVGGSAANSFAKNAVAKDIKRLSENERIMAE